MPELRKDPVIGRWVIIATERAKRPSDLAIEQEKAHGGFCPLCPGNEDRTPPELFAVRDDNSRADTPGWKLRVVPNKFPALVAGGDLDLRGEGIYDKMNGVGTHEVIVETPDHDASAVSLTSGEYRQILLAYRQRLIALKQDPRFKYIAIFKNYGEVAGATLEHPHSQLIALPIVPKRTVEKIDGAQAVHARTGRCIFCDIISQERLDRRRIIFENEHCVAFAPFASRFPFEVCLLPREHSASYELSGGALFPAMAEALSVVLKKLSLSLGSPPYNYMLHTAPFNANVGDFYHWHLEIIPRLTRVAGFEWGSGFYINPTPPEQAAQYLRETALE